MTQDADSPIERLRQTLNQQNLSADDLQRQLRRFAQAIGADTELDEEEHRRCQDRLPEMVAAAQQGEAVARLFPEETAHLDICRHCAEEYADLLDLLDELEAAVGQPVADPRPSLLPQLSPLKRLGGWLSDLINPLVERLEVDDAEGVRLALERFWAFFPDLLTPRQLRPGTDTALGFGGQGDPTLILLLMGGLVTDLLIGQYSRQEIETMIAENRLIPLVRNKAEEVAAEAQLEKALRNVFVPGYVAHVQRDSAAFAALFTGPGRPKHENQA